MFFLWDFCVCDVWHRKFRTQSRWLPCSGVWASHTKYRQTIHYATHTYFNIYWMLNGWWIADGADSPAIIQHPVRRFICIIFYCRWTLKVFRNEIELNWRWNYNESLCVCVFFFFYFVCVSFLLMVLSTFYDSVHVCDNDGSVRPK